MTRVLVADHQRSAAELAAFAVSRTGPSAAVALTAEAVLTALADPALLVVVLAAEMAPADGGAPILERILAARPDTRVMIRSRFPGAEAAAGWLDRGAADYLSADAGLAEVAARVRSQLRSAAA